jgi:RimJ/RimL family protein N-acetyltransferase
MANLLTPRLLLRPIATDDAAFYLDLVNTEAWLANIGDKGLRTVEAAREALLTGAIAAHEQHGMTIHIVQRREDDQPLGICGLIRRDTLPAPDIGYGYMPCAWGQGYAFEAAQAVFAHARDTVGLPRLMGITSPHNTGSIRVLEKLGLRYVETTRLGANDYDTRVYAVDF